MKRPWRWLLIGIAVICFGVAAYYPITYELNQITNNREMEELSAMRTRVRDRTTAAPKTEATEPEVTEAPTEAPTETDRPTGTPENAPTDGAPETKAPESTAAIAAVQPRGTAETDIPAATDAPAQESGAVPASPQAPKESAAPTATAGAGDETPIPMLAAGGPTDATATPAATGTGDATASTATGETAAASAEATAGPSPTATAQAIAGETPMATAEAFETAMPTATAGAMETATPTATAATTPGGATEAATAVPEVTGTAATGSPSPTATATPAATEPSGGTEWPEATAEPVFTAGPGETQTPEPGPTEEPTPEPTPSPVPTPSPEPTPSPTPSPVPTPTRPPTPAPSPTPDRRARSGPLPYQYLDKVDVTEEDILPELQEIYALNHDLVGWIYIDDTVIDYPVVQRLTDEDFYLNHDFYGNENNNGQILLDPKCDPFTPSYNLVISGHHMNSGKMFGNLPDYSSQSYWRTHKFVQFDTLLERKEYVIFAAFHSADYDIDEEGFRYNADIQYEMDADMWLEEIRKNRIYDTGIDVKFGDEFITLTTCNRARRKDGRFVVVARRIREGETFE